MEPIQKKKISVCENCKKEIKGKMSLVMSHEHKTGFAQSHGKQCDDETCEKERRRVKWYCENCSDCIPDPSEEDVCCGHSMTAIYKSLDKPGYFISECMDCGDEATFYNMEMWKGK